MEYIVYIAGHDQDLADAPDIAVLDEGLYIVRTEQTLSQLYHSIKRRTAPDRLLVAPLAGRPKFKGMNPGALMKAKSLMP